MKRLVIYCGSSNGTEEIYKEQAYRLGVTLASENIDLIYGGAQVGLMGAVADGALSIYGKVTGVIPHFLSSKEIAHHGLSQLIKVETMHQRKAKMIEMCDGAIALPGGFGTLEELFEILTWGQLGLHLKPVGLLNINGFYDDLMQLLDKMVTKGFLKGSNRDMLLVDDNIDQLLGKMHNYKAPPLPKWIT